MHRRTGDETAGQAFTRADGELDQAKCGPQHLRNSAIAEVVIEHLVCGMEQGRYLLASFCLMPNHVHVLLLPLLSANQILKTLKGVTAREANRILGRAGQPFWQSESYDHWVRDEAERVRIARYIENNPVRAGLARQPAEYRWSSANEAFSALWEHR